MLSDETRRELIQQSLNTLHELEKCRSMVAVCDKMSLALSNMDRSESKKMSIHVGVGDTSDTASITISDKGSTYYGTTDLLGTNNITDKGACEALSKISKQVAREAREFVVQRLRELHQKYLEDHDRIVCAALRVPYTEDRELRGVKIREKEGDVASE
jgi:uncharacterized protein YutE (UPF0331/DUF86 family)